MPDERYPAYDGARRPLAAAVVDGGPVAGRLVLRDASRTCWLADTSACVRFEPPLGFDLDDGDWISGRLAPEPAAAPRLVDPVRHTRNQGAVAETGLAGRVPALWARARIVDAVRGWFRDAGFLEVDTPARVICPGLEPHLVAFPAGGGKRLITSPELYLKRLLAAGAERVVELARAFRDEEAGPWHASEFTMLEWYRAFVGLDVIERDCEALITACVRAAGPSSATVGDGCRLEAPFERTTVRDALVDRTGIDLAGCTTRDTLAEAVARRGHPVADEDDFDTLFFRVWLAEVEPTLGRRRPVFVHGYPASQAALARTRPVAWGEVADRFELYVDGIEIANAFAELNDPVEQRRRHEADRAARLAAGRDAYPLDEPFLAALASGMPPAGGIALGLDRLIALLLGAGSIDEIRAFPEAEPGVG